MKTENKAFYKKLFALVIPIAVQNLMTALVSASDALMLGFLDQSSLSAVSLATQVQFVLNLFFCAILIGETILAAQYWGKEDKASVEKVLAIVLKLSTVIALVFFFAALLVPGALMRIFTNEKDLIELGIPYLRIVSWSYLFMGISQMFLCIMKNSGRTPRSTVYGSVAVILNIILNAVFIFGLFGCPKMEIRGAALATVISRAVELLLCMMENRKREQVCIRWKYLAGSNRELRKDFYRYTTPVMFNELAWGCGFTMFSVIMGHLGSDAVAANSLANIVKNIVSCFCLGIGAGSSIIVGNELGSGNLERAKVYGGKLTRAAIISGVLSAALMLACSPLILKFAYTLTDTAREYLKLMLFVCSYYIVGKAVNSTTIAGIFAAGGDTRFGLLCDTITMWVVVVPIGLLAAFVFKLPVMLVYLLLNTDEVIKLPAVYIHYKKYKWLNNLTRVGNES